MSNKKNKSEKRKDIRTKIEKLYTERYEGTNKEKFEPLYPKIDFFNEKYGNKYDRFCSNFRMAFAQELKILINADLLEEIEECASESGVDIATYINYLLLIGLDRNRPINSRTSGINKYINRLYEASGFISFTETIEEFRENLIKFNINLERNFIDTDEINYIKKYLFNNGYTNKELKELSNFEYTAGSYKGFFLSFKIKETGFLTGMAIPYYLELGIRYMTSKFKGIKKNDIEEFIKKSEKEGIMIWDLFKIYLKSEKIEPIKIYNTRNMK